MWSEAEKIQAKAQADQDIAVGDGFINTMADGIRKFEFFEKDTDRVNKIATLIQCIEMAFDDSAVKLVAACAIEMLATERGPWND